MSICRDVLWTMFQRFEYVAEKAKSLVKTRVLDVKETLPIDQIFSGKSSSGSVKTRSRCSGKLSNVLWHYPFAGIVRFDNSIMESSPLR